MTSIALAAIDTALWDLRCKRAKLPLWRMAGGAQRSVPLYSTEGGWLHIETSALVDDALAVKAKGFSGAKIKIGRPHVAEDVARLSAVRDAVGPAFEIMTDANQGFNLSEAIRRARHYQELDIAWFEEPMHADDVEAHAQLTRSTAVPNGRYVEYIPQLDEITHSRMTIKDGRAVPSDEPGLGIEWDHSAIEAMAIGKQIHQA